MKLKISPHFLILIILAIGFFFIYSWFSLSVILPEANNFEGQKIFSWPDAMANNFFINQFVENGSFVDFSRSGEFDQTRLNREAPLLQNYLHPRSVNVLNGDIVPMSFLGMLIIFGWLGKLVGFVGGWVLKPSIALMCLTPFFAVIGVLFFYGLIKEIFNKTVGFISALLLFALASYWYYANLSMLHTILFVSLLIIGLYFFVNTNNPHANDANMRMPRIPSVVYSCLSGFFIGLALITRSIEFIWVGLLIIVPFIFYIKKVRLKNVLLFLLGAAFPLAILLYYNWQIYGELFTVGYLKMNGASSVLERLPNEFEVPPTTEVGGKVASYLKFIFIPFGFHIKMILLNFKKYFVEFLFPYFYLAIVGFGIWVIKLKVPFDYAQDRQSQKSKVSFESQPLNLKKRETVYFITAALAGLWLVIYYGSWEFVDPLVLKYNTIGSSYTRYFLPLNILILPVIAYLLWRILKLKISKILTVTLVVLSIFGLTLYSHSLVYLTPGDGLFAQREVIQTYYQQAKAVDALVESNAIIIVNRADKLFFPKRQVIQFNLDYSIFPLLKKIVNDIPVYYFTLMPDKDINYINNSKIGSLNLKFIEPSVIDGQFRLFRLVNPI